jgi:hypothetical protein
MASEASTPSRQDCDSSLTDPGGLSNNAQYKLFYSAHGSAKLCHAIQNNTKVIAKQIYIAWGNIAVDPVKMNIAFQKVIAASTATLADTQKLVEKLERITGAGESNTGEPISDGLGAASVTQFESDCIVSNMAAAALATFSESEQTLYFRGLNVSGDHYATITDILRRRAVSLEQA